MPTSRDSLLLSLHAGVEGVPDRALPLNLAARHLCAWIAALAPRQERGLVLQVRQSQGRFSVRGVVQRTHVGV